MRKWSKEQLIVLMFCLFLGMFLTFLQTFSPLKLNMFNSKWIDSNEECSAKNSNKIIHPTHYRLNHIEILDFILYRHRDKISKYSIFFSGRRSSWTFTRIDCLFNKSNQLVNGIIDRRSSEPFVTCPLPSIENDLILNRKTSFLSLSIRINDQNYPNRSFVSSNLSIPIYCRKSYNLSIYTMIKNKRFELIEWIEYHLMIGIEHIYLYDHLSTDHFQTILEDYLKKDLITIVKWPYQSLEGHHWNMMQSASMNHALKNFGPFNKWLAYFDVDEYFQINNFNNYSINNLSLSHLLDQHFPESLYPGGVQFQNCPVACFLTQDDIVTSRYYLLLEKCRFILNNNDCQIRTKMFIRPKNVPIMQNIHALQYGIKFADYKQSTSFGLFRHFHYGFITANQSFQNSTPTSIDFFIPKLKQKIIYYK